MYSTAAAVLGVNNTDISTYVANGRLTALPPSAWSEACIPYGKASWRPNRQMTARRITLSSLRQEWARRAYPESGKRGRRPPKPPPWPVAVSAKRWGKPPEDPRPQAPEGQRCPACGATALGPNPRTGRVECFACRWS